MLFLQADLHEGRIHRGVGRVDCGEIRVNADIRNDHVHIGRFHDAANNGFNLGNVIVAHFQPCAAWHTNVDDELARIGAREVGASEKGK